LETPCWRTAATVSGYIGLVNLFRAVLSAQFSPVEFWGMWLAQVGAREMSPNAVSG
jgi:hypothetical protein